MDSSAKELDSVAAIKRSLMPKNKLCVVVETEEGREYCCVKCPAKYNDKDKMEVHMCSHLNEYRFLCGICGTGLKRKEHLDRHTLGHQEVRPHVCPECGKGFKRKEHLNIHVSIHSGDKTQICPLCHRSFYRKDHLQKHLQTHTKLLMEQNMYALSDQEMMAVKQEVLDDDDIKPVFDDDDGCEITMEVGEENRSAQNDYIRSSDPQRPFECVLCHKTYKRKDHLKLHSLSHVPRDKICERCGKGYHKEEQLQLHMRSHVEAERMNPNIQSCDIDIMPLDSLSLLAPRGGGGGGGGGGAGGAESRPHGCAVCGRRFKRKQHLKVHANVHLKSTQPTIWCSLCNEGFHSNPEFESHHCPGEVEQYPEDSPPSAPTDAKKENNQPEFLPIPIVNCLSAPPLPSEAHIPSPVRVYVCKYCQKPFKRKDHYKIHLHIHTGIKTFYCPDCGKGFYRKDHLQKHMQVHQRPKPRARRSLPALYPINLLKQLGAKPEITITAPAHAKLRVPLQMKVPYQMVISSPPRALSADELSS